MSLTADRRPAPARLGRRALAPLLCGLLARPALAEGDLLTEIMSGLAARPSRHATFTEEKRLASLTTPLVSQGELLYRRPDYLEKKTAPPHAETLVIQGGTLSIQSADGVTRQLSLAENPLLQATADTIRGTIAGDLSALRRYYRITEKGDRTAWEFTLVPQDATLAKQLRSVVLTGTGSDVRTILTTDANGDTDRMTLTTLE